MSERNTCFPDILDYDQQHETAKYEHWPNIIPEKYEGEVEGLEKDPSQNSIAQLETEDGALETMARKEPIGKTGTVKHIARTAKNRIYV